MLSPPPPRAWALCKLGKNSTTKLYASARCSFCAFNFEKGFYVAWQIDKLVLESLRLYTRPLCC